MHVRQPRQAWPGRFDAQPVRDRLDGFVGVADGLHVLVQRSLRHTACLGHQRIDKPELIRLALI